MIAEYSTYAMGAILVVAFLLEIRTGRIPNWLTLLPLAIFAVVLIMAEDRSTLYWQIGLAVIVFCYGLAMFAIGGMGAGAAKLMAGTALFVPWGVSFYTFLIFLVIFFLSAFLIVQFRKIFGSPDSSWHVMANAIIPLSFPIMVAGLLGMFVL